MSFFSNLFKSKEEKPITPYQEFWDWFIKNEKKLYKAIQHEDNIDEKVLDPLIERLHIVNEYFYCQVGMFNDTTADLVITAEGDIKSFVFVDDIIDAAPKLPNWKFTNLKPKDGTDLTTHMAGYTFSPETLGFIANIDPDYPDEIEITLIHKDFNAQNEKAITNGSYIYLDTILGEYNAAIIIDSVIVKGTEGLENELIPIQKLENYLIWREKEFIEKYKGIRNSNDEKDTFSSYEAKTKEGNPVFAIMNRSLLDWDAKPSYPWMMVIEFTYEGNNGLPNDENYKTMDVFEDELVILLKSTEGYLNIGRQTGGNSRQLYFGCKEFKKSSKTTAALIQKYKTQLDITYDIYRDKYWRTLNRFIHI
jgi:hypothetical protein